MVKIDFFPNLLSGDCSFNLSCQLVEKIVEIPFPVPKSLISYYHWSPKACLVSARSDIFFLIGPEWDARPMIEAKTPPSWK